jgi:uroporphyrinogen III methyltransferase/synthase
VLVTRALAGEQAGTASALLAERGAEAVVVSTIAIHPPPEPQAVQRAIERLGSYDWVVFTSANGVRWAWEAIAAGGRGAASLAGVRVAAVGPATAAALAERGVRTDVVPADQKGEGLADEILGALRREPRGGPSGAGPSVLILRAREAREVLPERLRAAGCTVDVVAVYETRPVPGVEATLRQLLSDGRLDAVTFTSSSTVDNLCDAVGPDAPRLLGRLCVVSIGPITTRSAEARGVRVDATADPSTLPALVEALALAMARRAALSVGASERRSGV